MKKILALVLALVMTMSMATISSGAAYSDADKVQYVDAVNTMSALGVMGGYADGSIRPQADVTRGAAAKMVAMVATGSNATTIGYYAGTSSFADVPASHTFADAVAYCVARGIVAGYGNGYYGVGDNVKGWAVAKMVLVAMGYDAEAYGLTGSGQDALNTITLASQVGLFNGMAADFVATEAASREECAQIVYNALTIEGVKVKETTSNGVVSYTGSGKVLLENYIKGANDSKSALEQLNKGVVTANQATGEYYTVIGGENYNLETGLDLIGHMVTVVKSSVQKTDDYGTKYYDAYAVVDLSKVVTVAADISGETKFDAAFGKAAISDASAKVFKNYSVVTAADGFEDGKSAKAGTYVLYTNEAGATSLVSVLTSDLTVGYVTNYKAGTAKVNGSLKVDGVEFDVNETIYTVPNSTGVTVVSYYDGIAKDDVVVVEKTGKLITVSKAATVTGTVGSYDAKNFALTIDGTTYYTSYDYTETGLNITGLLAPAAAVATKVVAYLDNTGAVFAMVAAPDATTAAGLVYTVANYKTGVAGAYGSSEALYVQCVDMDGKEVSYQVEKALDDADLKDLKNVSTYVGADGVTYANFAAPLTNAEIKDDVATDIGAYDVKVASTNNYFASNVKFLFVTGEKELLKVEVKSGVQAVTDAYDYYMTTSTTGNNTVQYVVVNAPASTSVESTDVVYVSANAAVTKGTYTGTDGKLYSCDVYGVYINGEYKTVKVAAGKAPVKGIFNQYSVDSATGLYSFAKYEKKVVVDGTVSNLYGSMLTVKDSVLVDIDASAAKIIDVYYAENSATNSELVEITSLDGLFAEAGTNATVSVVYEETAGYPSSIVAIYVVKGPVETTGDSTTGGSTTGVLA